MCVSCSKRGFVWDFLPEEEILRLRELSRICKGDILKMTNIAGSGHPGGSISSLDIYLVVYSYARVYPEDPYREDRDRIIVSHGHTSPALYSVLGRLGFFSIDEAIATFRKAGSIFEGHVERKVPGIEWSTGNLGQGLSAGCGFALASKIRGLNYNTFVIMSDAEQIKGQVSEARKFAKKFALNNLTVIIDYNDMQISGRFSEIMPANIEANYLADGWGVIKVDGHDHAEIYRAIKMAISDSTKPYAIIARTVMGKGVSFMENNNEYHGRALREDELKRALEELGIDDDREKYIMIRNSMEISAEKNCLASTVSIDIGIPPTYRPSDKIDARNAFGRALLELGKLNNRSTGKTKIVVFDCDLASSVKVDYFAKELPEYFFEAGVEEHNTATVAGALSVNGVISVFADFGVFGIDEVYNQQRLNDINCTNLKLVLTHLGVDVGQDGKTHHCIDYIGLIRNLYGFKLIIPADANQMDRAVRYALSFYGNVVIGTFREPQPIILDEKGEPFFGGDYRFTYGEVNVVREGRGVTVLSYGNMLSRALKAINFLAERGLKVRLVNVPCPLDPDMDRIGKWLEEGPVIVYEDHNYYTGLGSVIADKMVELGIKGKLVKMGVKEYAPSGVPDELHKVLGLSVDDLVNKILEVTR
ncbi:MAG: transketolase [Thermosulfidibacteraceae bacterium]|jgi:transketolase